MKHFALTILALLYVLTCLAQEYNEVVFEVRKPKQVNTYYYKETTRDWKTKDGATLSFLCSQNEGDTFHFYSLNAFSLDSISDIRTSLKHRKDTVNVKYLYHSYYSKYGDTIIERKTGTDGRSHGHLIFCDSAYEMRQGLIPHKVYKRGKIGRATYMVNKNVEIKVGDSIFTCIKVLEVDAHIRGGEIWSKGIMVLAPGKGFTTEPIITLERKTTFWLE